MKFTTLIAFVGIAQAIHMREQGHACSNYDNNKFNCEAAGDCKWTGTTGTNGTCTKPRADPDCASFEHN